MVPGVNPINEVFPFIIIKLVFLEDILHFIGLPAAMTAYKSFFLKRNRNPCYTSYRIYGKKIALLRYVFTSIVPFLKSSWDRL
jgi:hypothetical protein